MLTKIDVDTAPDFSLLHLKFKVGSQENLSHMLWVQ